MNSATKNIILQINAKCVFACVPYTLSEVVGYIGPRIEQQICYRGEKQCRNNWCCYQAISKSSEVRSQRVFPSDSYKCSEPGSRYSTLSGGGENRSITSRSSVADTVTGTGITKKY